MNIFISIIVDSLLLLLALHLLLLPLLSPVAEPHLDGLGVDLELLCQLLGVVHVRRRVYFEVLVQSLYGLWREHRALLSSEMSIMIM